MLPAHHDLRVPAGAPAVSAFEGEPGDQVVLVLSTVYDVLELPAHHVYVVARPDKPDAMIPAVPAFIAEIDIHGAQRLVVRPIEGLLD